MANKVQELQKQILELTNTINKNGQATKEQAKQLQRLEKEYNKLASKVMPQYRKGQQEINQQLSKAKKFTDAASKSSQGYFGRLRTAIGTLSRYAIAYSGVNAIMTIGRELFINSAKRAIELEKALADVAAVANLTASDMQRLEKVVFEVAGTTSLTAVEVVELQKQLAKLGTTVDELEDLTRPVALLAQALGEEPGGVAAALKKTLNQFQQTSEQADRFANVLVGAVNESALSLNDLGTALQYVGPLASQSGLTFEYTASLLGILADNGFRASRAGTGLRNVLLEAAKDGRPFADFLEDLAVRNLDVAEATELFGKRGASAAIVLANNTEEVRRLNDELKENTRLLNANAKQMSSTQGQIDLLTSAYNRASIRLGEYITQTEFFVEILERLDPSVAGQARAFKFLANASEEGQEAFESLTTAMVGFQTTDEELTEGLEARWSIIAEAGMLSSKQIQNLRNQYDKMIASGKDMPLSEFLSMQSESYGLEEFEDAAIFLEGIVTLGAERAKVIREQKIADAAQNDNYKEAVILKEKLTQQAKEGVMTDKEQLRVSEGLRKELKMLQNQRERSANVEDIIILEKRIEYFERLAEAVENLKNNEKFFEEILTLPAKGIGSITDGDIPEMELRKPAEIVTKTFYDKVKEAFEGLDWGAVIVEAVGTATEAIEDFNDTALQNTKNRLEQELDAIQSRFDIEEDILRSQLDNQLLTESQFRQKQIDLRKAQIREENDIEKQLFDAQNKRDRQDASSDYLIAIASIIPTLIAYDKTADPVSVLTKAAITGGLATAAYGAELSAIGQRKFYPKKFAEGGVVNGPSHEQGGVPFSVQGQGGYEMEGGEYIVNKRATAMHRDLLDRINNSYRTSPMTGSYKFAQGGLVNAPMNESVDYLKAIAEATTSTAMNVSKPVRAFVSDKDLRSNATERRIRDRNDRL